MAKKTTLNDLQKRTYSGSLLGEDQEVSKRLEEVNRQAEQAVFDNTHKTDKLQKVYDELDKKTLQQSMRDEAYDDFNPFYGDKNALEKLSKQHTYKEIVSTPQSPAPTLEIKEEIKPETYQKPKTKRSKLWFVTGAICIALFAGLFTYNMININSLAKKVVTTQNDITQQEQVLQDGLEAYQNRLADLDSIATSGMIEADLSGASTVDLSAKNDGNTHQQSTNLWDKICNFFAKLFGRN